MSQEPPKKPDQQERANERPLSLYPMSLEQALKKALAYKPDKPKKKSRPKSGESPSK